MILIDFGEFQTLQMKNNEEFNDHLKEMLRIICSGKKIIKAQKQVSFGPKDRKSRIKVQLYRKKQEIKNLRNDQINQSSYIYEQKHRLMQQRLKTKTRQLNLEIHLSLQQLQQTQAFIQFLSTNSMIKPTPTLGIVRNRFTFYTDNKQKMEKKKNRFKVIDRDNDSVTQSTPRLSDNLLTCASSTNTSIESLQLSSPSCKDFYDQAREKLQKVEQLQKKMSLLSKARLSSFKEKENEKYDEQISKLAGEATNYLSQSEKLLKKLNSVQTKTENEVKMMKNMQLSLAQQIRQSSRNLRQQQREYYDTIRQYESSSKNRAIQLTQDQKKMFQVEQEMLEVQTNSTEDNKIHELVQSINKLSTIYKELNNLVIEQGSLIDRIDVNIQETYEHTVKAVGHLEVANQHASSAFADKVIKVLVILIISLAFVLGLKYMN